MKQILLVDDESSFREPLQRVLQQAGFQVETAGDGQSALDQYRRQPADLVLIDLIMPIKEGLETIPELRRLNPSLKIIAMSGGGRLDPNSYLDIACCLGADLTLAKPFTREELITAVNQLLAEPQA